MTDNCFPNLPRRRFVQGLVSGSVALSLGLPGAVVAGPGTVYGTQSPATLTGTEFDLVIDETPVNFTGQSRMATTINGSIPAPTLVWKEGETVTLRVKNQMNKPTSIHWHGIILPYQMDGVPGISFAGIAPGQTFTYQFKVQQNGTYWYHSHTGFQEMTGMYGAIIILPGQAESAKADRDFVVQLSDWTDEDPMAVFAKLKQQSDYYNYNQPTVRDFFADMSRYGLSDALAMRKMWNEMRMNPTDLADLSASTLTFLLNGQPANGNWTGIFKPGETIKLRFINGASNSFFDVRIPGLKMTVIAADGQDLEPVSVDEFRFGPGETYDVLVKPSDDAHTIFAQSMDRTGYAKGTLAVQAGLSAPVPMLDKPQWLTMEDMMGKMQHAGHSMDGHAQHQSAQRGEHDKHKMHGAMAMDHSQHKMAHNPLRKPSQSVRHARTEYGPSVDMRLDMPRTNLDDPGIGLRDNQRRVLTLADQRSRADVLDDKRIPDTEIELHLTGNMERYSWSIDGLEFGQSTPVFMPHGQRIRVILQNDTMMTHPMHLHGMWSDLETDNGELSARRHTIPVQPAQRISFLTTPHDLGRWAWHCHLLFHMDAGMFREVVVA
ncbi:copper resistance system multicopper oxidase [Aliiglaciecola sp. CAU 1673]|uniref:copper resistance system multicopper oxidase n=1 Tax=Aliiglaciecola sp. CAU 1673 TaxID=3032595 RepID=UPI0023D9F3BA|nr:copper resistance system multicopper oxidase [Aliiglaciecola sp. CAU 1673]MDF2179878.1 copper resistance system multicopper oxidase [Aliiglaciecola sp. CAU 1673]